MNKENSEGIALAILVDQLQAKIEIYKEVSNSATIKNLRDASSKVTTIIDDINKIDSTRKKIDGSVRVNSVEKYI